jgi:hypothetical protein
VTLLSGAARRPEVDLVLGDAPRVLLRALEQRCQRIEDRRRDAAFATWDGVVIRVIGVVEDDARAFAGCRIARNDVQMDVPVLVLQERIVEVIGRECPTQPFGGALHLRMELKPLRC